MKYDDEKCLVILDKYQEAIEDAVSYAVITSSEDLYHEDEDEIIREYSSAEVKTHTI